VRELADKGEPIDPIPSLRVHVEALWSLAGQGRHRDALASERELIALLDQAPFDTRREGAERWERCARYLVPRDGPFYPDERGEPEHAFRQALTLYLAVGEIERAAVIVVELVAMFQACGARVALDGLIDELVAKLPQKTAQWLRRERPAQLKLTSVLHGLAHRLEMRTDEPAPPPAPAMAVGQKVRHQRFGDGQVVDVAADAQRIVTVKFADGATRRLVERTLTRV
jgi:hypothetical protein